MSDKLMDTEPGGEQTQYEGIHTFVEPHNKQAGQFGDPATHTSSPSTQPKPDANAPNTQGVSKADKIRYGQSIQEGGMGGKTTGSSGGANQEGFGGAKKMEGEEEGESAKERRVQGYGGEQDMDNNVGG